MLPYQACVVKLNSKDRWLSVSSDIAKALFTTLWLTNNLLVVAFWDGVPIDGTVQVSAYNEGKTALLRFN